MYEWISSLPKWLWKDVSDCFGKTPHNIFLGIFTSDFIFAYTEAATQRFSLEKVFWKYVASLHENTHDEVRFQ